MHPGTPELNNSTLRDDMEEIGGKEEGLGLDFIGKERSGSR